MSQQPINKQIVPVILSGGSGTRLWPLSRTQFPKQFLPLLSEKSLFQETLARLPENPGISDALIVCNDSHRFTIAEQLRVAGKENSTVILEPCSRNTAPAIAFAALAAKRPDDLLLVLPADHEIKDQRALAQAIELASEEAATGALVTFGIVPRHAETGYGYIKFGSSVGDKNIFNVSGFVEKPDLDTAEKYLGSGNYLWNSGMFLFRADRILEELGKYRPEILAACRKAYSNAVIDQDFIRLDAHSLFACPSESIDYAVMEHTEAAVTTALDAGWCDVGSWSALWELSEKDEQGNSVRGDVITEDTNNCLVRSEKRLIATLGVSDLVIVETDDVVLVASRERAQDVKRLAEQLKAANRTEADAYRKVYRPWGWYDSVDFGNRHQAKRICVNPGAKLSLQMHYHRAEHWVVIKGTAKITLDDREIVLTEDQSTYIPLGTKHRLENIGKIPLEIIEVQTGSYLGEDDIVRFSDDYGRHNERAAERHSETAVVGAMRPAPAPKPVAA